MSRLSAAYLTAYQKLNPEQKRAVDLIDGPVLVIAGPGTGKTQLLSTRVGRILEMTDAAPQNILCLTFSEAAAFTMQNRLVQLIGSAAYEVNVSTYHSFGSELIRSYLKEDVRPADELILHGVLSEVLTSLDYSNPLKKDYYIGSIKELISGYKRALITPNQLEQICTANEEFILAATEMVKLNIQPTPRINIKELPAYRNLLAASDQLPTTAEDLPIDKVTPLKTIWLEQLSSAIDDCSESGKMTALSKWKSSWLEKDATAQLRVTGLKTLSRQRAFSEIFTRYNTALKDKGLYDYDDMIMHAIDGLNAQPDLKYSLQERYLYILLDEFQDTNEAQFSLVELLSDNPINERRPNILAVGDDDQAVYAFQGAHYSHMQRFYQNYDKVEIISLKTNYRSTEGIIRLADSIRGQIEDRLNLAPKLLEPSIDTRQTNAKKKEEIKRVELKLDVEQLAWVGEYINKLIKKGEVAADEIAVLAPKHKYLIDLIPYLSAQGIPISYEQKDNILESERLVDLINGGRLIVGLSTNDNSTADALWPVVLSQQQWSLPASLIWEFSWQARDGHKSWSEILLTHQKTGPIALFFIRLAQIERYTPFESMLGYLLGSRELELNEDDVKTFVSPFYSTYFAGLDDPDQSMIKAGQWKLIGQLTILRARAIASSEESLTLSGLISLIDAYKAAGLKIIDSNPFQSSDRAVNLMTAFAAKGREFRVVILIDLTDQAWGASARERTSSIALPPNLSQVRAGSSSSDDRLRLLFVAASRAKQQLLLTSYQEDLAGSKTSPLRYLNETGDNEKGILSPYLPTNSQTVLTPNIPPQSEKLLAKPLWFDAFHMDYGRDLKRQALLKDRLSKFVLSATKLNDYTDVSRGGPGKFYLDNILQFPKTQPLSAQYGTAMHLSMDWQFRQAKALGRQPKLNEVIAQFTKQLAGRRLPPEDYQKFLARGENALTSYFSQQTLPIEFNNQDLSEETFSTVFGDNNIRLNGKIDRLIVDKKTKTITIVDFKTGDSYERMSNSDIRSMHHKRQLYFYKLLIELSGRFNGYSVSGGIVQFIEPESAFGTLGQFKQVNITFDSDYFAQTKKLIEAVWANILSLNFKTQKNYKQTAAGIREFEAELIKSLNI